jgi:hypothetical protein
MYKEEPQNLEISLFIARGKTKFEKNFLFFLRQEKVGILLPASWFSITLELLGIFSTRGRGGRAGGSVGAGPRAVSLLRRISRAFPMTSSSFLFLLLLFTLKMNRFTHVSYHWLTAGNGWLKTQLINSTVHTSTHTKRMHKQTKGIKRQKDGKKERKERKPLCIFQNNNNRNSSLFRDQL